MKKFVCSALLMLSACQSFEAGGLRQDQESESRGVPSAGEEGNVETQIMINTIIQSNRLKKSNDDPSSSKVDGSLSYLNSPPIGQRTTPVYGNSLQVGSTKRTDMSAFGKPMQSATQSKFGRQ